LRTIVAVHLGLRFAVPRPRALLGDAAHRRLLSAIESVVRRHAPRTMRLSAAGAESAEMSRVRDAIRGAFDLTPVAARAELVVSVRRAPDPAAGWDVLVLVRTTPRPLSARRWRVCDFPGALDASVAAAMARLVRPRADRILNVGCGSATLLVESLETRGASLALGVDVDATALACALRNLDASGHFPACQLVRADGSRLPVGDGAFGAVVADLPFGHLSGSARDNRRLYPSLLEEIRRVLKPLGRACLITANVATLRPHLGGWQIERYLQPHIPFARGSIAAGIWLLRR
jgi:SAM-dependent methyltransferase